jgi:hypothetical protein
MQPLLPLMAGKSVIERLLCGSVCVARVQGTPSRGITPTGFFSTPEDAEHNSTRYWKEPCPAGHFCIDGVRQLCPAGTFGSSAQLSTPECNGRCMAGYYCVAGSMTPTNRTCGDPSVFCPEVWHRVADIVGLLCILPH